MKAEFYIEAHKWVNMFIYLCLLVCFCESVHLPARVRRLWLSADDDSDFVDSTFRLKTRGSLVELVCIRNDMNW